MLNSIGKFARSVGDFKGKRRLVRMLLRSSMPAAKNVEMQGLYGCRYTLPNIHEPVAFDLFINGVYEKDTLEYLAKTVPVNGTLLDIGANIGSVSIPLCKQRPDIRCIAVEASEWVFQYLVKNVRHNGLENQIDCINKAVSDTAEGFTAFYTNEDVFGKGSMAPVFSESGKQVKRTTLDELVEQYKLTRVHMIKIDIEGFEYMAFKGGEKLLRSENAPVILFEFVDWAEKLAGFTPGDAQRLLKDWGYRIYDAHFHGTLKEKEALVEKGGLNLIATKRGV